MYRPHQGTRELLRLSEGVPFTSYNFHEWYISEYWQMTVLRADYLEDIANQPAPMITREFDKSGARTIGMTKLGPVLIDRGAYQGRLSPGG